jgi:hypothetical protein
MIQKASLINAYYTKIYKVPGYRQTLKMKVFKKYIRISLLNALRTTKDIRREMKCSLITIIIIQFLHIYLKTEQPEDQGNLYNLNSNNNISINKNQSYNSEVSKVKDIHLQ